MMERVSADYMFGRDSSPVKYQEIMVSILESAVSEIRPNLKRPAQSTNIMQQERDTNMKAVIADTLGPPENYHLREIEQPPVAAGSVRVKVYAASLGYVDALIAAGGYQIKPPTPYIPGSEFAGVVDAIGTGECTFQIGDRVCGYSFGRTLAEYVVVEDSALSVLPAPLSFADGASILVNFRTGLYALKQRANLRPGETLLVFGAAGGVGSSAVQLGRAMGARVIAGASTAAKREFALGNGATDVLDYSDEHWRDALKEMTGGRGVDVIYDPVGGRLLEPGFRSMAWGGRYLVIGFTGGEIPSLPVNLALLKGASLVGVDILQFGNREPELAAENTQLIWQWFAQQKISAPAGPVYPLSEFRAALGDAQKGSSLGKIIVQLSTW